MPFPYMNFKFGCAAKLYANHIHPRVVMGPNDIPRLRAAIRSGVCRKIMDGMRRKVAPLAKRVLTDTQPVAAFRSAVKGVPDYSVIWNIADMALVGTLDECDETIRAARKALLTVTEALDDPAQCGGNIYTMMYGCHPLAYDLLYSRLSDGERRAYIRWIIDACLRPALAAPRSAYYQNAGANTPICYTLPILIGLLAIRGDPGAPDLTDDFYELVLRLSATLHATIGVDGYPEEDIGYGTAVVAGLAQVIEPLRRAGIYDAYGDCPRYAKFGNAILHFVQPWGGSLSNTGDMSDCIISRETVLARQAEETASPTLLWLLGRLIYPTIPPRSDDAAPPSSIEVLLRKGCHVPATGWSLLFSDRFNKGSHPARSKAPTAFRDRTRGIVSFRSGWDDDAALLVFDGSQRSPACQGHMHASAGHFSFSAFGERFAIDTGRYNIEQNCHNVVLVDGVSGRSTRGEWEMTYWHGNLTDYRPGRFCDSAAADSSLQHNCYWARRRVGLVKGARASAYAWTLDDINKADDWAEFWWQLHTSPENTISIKGQTATITGWRHGNLLDAHFILPPPNAYPKSHTLRLDQDEALPSSHHYIPNPREAVALRYDRPADQVHGPGYARPRLLARVGGYNGRFMTIMLPRLKGDPRPRVEALPTLDNTLAARLTFKDVEDTIICAYEHHILEANGINGRGDWCVVRRDRKTQRILCYEIGDGTRLKVDGRRLRV